MVQLILTIIAIALAAATALATVNYSPWWTQVVGETDASVRASVRKLETAYISTARTSTLAALEPNANPDGGLMAIYGAVLGFKPGAPLGYTWVYGKATAGAYANTHYFCMQPDGTSSGRNESVAKALARAANGYSSEQFVVASTCGATAPEDMGTTGIPVLTFYVKPLPDVGL